MEERVNIQEQKQPKEKTGRGKKALLVLLFLVLLGGVSYGAYWYGQDQGKKQGESAIVDLQNQLENAKAKSASQVKSEDSEKLTETITVKDSKNSFTLMYPKSWSLKTSNRKLEGLPASWVSQQGTITSPSGEVIVGLDTGITGIGGACVKDEAGNIKTLQVTAIPNSAGYSYMQYSSGGPVKNTSGLELVYGATVVKNEIASKTKVGTNFCDIYLSEMLQMGDEIGLASFTVRSKTIDKLREAEKDPTAAQIETFFASDEFNTAKQILLSLKIN